ncbi:mannosyltransferase OCH1-like enzyme [Pullulanibacillus pueri]|uniref:Uncharacterized protein n=1 Tax=Pullulanibacillus pueri TaxID=1437324 RepID=A0A8J3EN58_9BACL|nr:hypothetical protein [Pullulanibacillus pueri]MBM7683728.1 mannosyltransferase OCH1-like enzyme [Pullulanibacillus pueri]GGH85144.1 hypothetical protein GCM10007096_29850 [Pullulanibacillus pueri]
MPRKNSKQARFDRMTQRQQHRYKKQKYFAKKHDGKNWTDRMFKNLNNTEADES